MLIGIHEARGIAVLPSDENGRHSLVEHQIAVGFLKIVERAGVLVAHADIDRGGGSDLPAVFGEAVVSPVAKIHLRHSGLALLHRRET